MNKNPFEQKITKTLDTLAKQHPQSPQVISNVLKDIRDQKQRQRNGWKITSLAFAAVLASIIIAPNIFHIMSKDESTQTAMATTEKLSPQMVEDLEMVMVFGENNLRHGS
ncbi:hypothetical protein [Acinetobacter boissieri]|uniref:Uncharacterized protein n=1 Tax=Acinetobacter boissieri TaxID=1219383 RepID=A0A1G6GSM6_9GAMM|nr:hypothetical protein [Acinetobacter boissieri]SDB84997.1 hypothetical protein SAMN05421733_102153 [Acinetobacter boissieri]